MVARERSPRKSTHAVRVAWLQLLAINQTSLLHNSFCSIWLESHADPPRCLCFNQRPKVLLNRFNLFNCTALASANFFCSVSLAQALNSLLFMSSSHDTSLNLHRSHEDINNAMLSITLLILSSIYSWTTGKVLS